jgi:hypothetical protein
MWSMAVLGKRARRSKHLPSNQLLGYYQKPLRGIGEGHVSHPDFIR